MDENYFDPQPMASPNLDEADPLREWAAQLQDPEIAKLMATDPEAAAKKLADLGIPPPPPHIMRYTDGLSRENSPGTPIGGSPPLPTQTVGGAPSLPVVRTLPNGKIAGNITDNDPPSYTDPMGAVPGGTAAPATGGPLLPPTKPGALFGYIGGGAPPAAPVASPQVGVKPGNSRRPSQDIDPGFDPAPEPEFNPSAGQPLVPRARPVEAGPTDISAKKKEDTGDALSGFSKSLAGVKPVPGAPPNYVGTPAVRSHGNISAPNLQTLLGLVGQAGPSPLGLTLGRLLATGKA